jgi:hypothetical protein
MTMKSFAFRTCCAVLFFVAGLQAQTTKEEFLAHSDYVGGLYRLYVFDHAASTPAPDGYVPFYISHYGRHGSRWLLTPAVYSVPRQILGEAEQAGFLTPSGKSLFARLTVAAADAADRYGDLSPLGAVEQRGIAERMVRSFPEIFTTENGRQCIVNSRSTQVPRCILSMAAHNERLKELAPAVQISRDATKRDTYLNNDPEINRDTIKVLVADFLRRHFSPRRFIGALFTDTAYARTHIKDQTEFVNFVFQAAINMPNLDHLHIDLMDVFTKDELYILWQASNLQMYLTVGPSSVNGTSAVRSAIRLLKDIVDRAEAAIAAGSVSADLRFGHDSYIIPLLALMDINGMNVREPDPDRVYAAWSNFRASPMGTNLQLVFYRNAGNGDVLVKVLHCERETSIPVGTDVAPYYHWKDVKAYYQKKIGG